MTHVLKSEITKRTHCVTLNEDSVFLLGQLDSDDLDNFKEELEDLGADRVTFSTSSGCIFVMLRTADFGKLQDIIDHIEWYLENELIYN